MEKTGGMAGVSAKMLEPVSRMSQTDEQLQELDRMVSRLAGCLDRLDGKLQGVLRAEKGCEVEGSPEETLVPVAENIRIIRKRVGWSCDHIDSILNRLEV